MRISVIAILTLIVLGPLVASPAAAASVVVSDCRVSLIEEAQVPAQESGELMSVSARDGQQVSADEVLAHIGDKLAKLELDVRLTELDVAKKRAEDMVSINYARAAAKVYEADYWRKIEVNKRAPGAVPKADIELALLQYEQYRLQTEKSRFELEIAALEVKVSEAQVDAAKEHIVRREIKAPWDGIVDEVHRHTGDWVQPGDPILRLVRMDRLRIKCYLNASHYAPNEIMNHPVTVTVKLAHDVTDKFDGKITGVSPLVEANNHFLVWAEVENKKQNGYWVLRAGMVAEMTIDLN